MPFAANSILQTFRTHGDAVAFIDANTHLTYEQLAQLVASRAERMQEIGIKRGVRIAFSPSNDLDTLVTFWSLFTLQAVACPISHRYPQTARASLCSLLGANWWQQATSTLSSSFVDDSGAATVILSSGSTGTPKAVVHAMAAHVASAEAAATVIPLHHGDRWLWTLPAYHVSGLSILFRCALAGATVCGMSSDLTDAILRQSRITHISLVSTQLRRLLMNQAFAPTVRHVLLGGSALPKSLLKEALRCHVPLHASYGMTELATQIATTPRLHPSGPATARVLPHCNVRIDQRGEIHVRSPSLCLGYDKRGRLQPVVDEEGWFHTGDIGVLDGEDLTVTGRLDNMFISGGENLYPEAVERELMELPEIHTAVVVPRDDQEFGARPVAFVDARDWNPTLWRHLLRTKLRGFEVPVDFLPLPIPTGDLKPNRASLRDLANA